MEIKKIPKLLIVFSLFFFSSLWQLIGLKIFNYDVNNLTDFNTIVLTTFSEVITLIILMIIYRKELKNDFKSLKNNFNKNMDITVKSWLIGLLIMFVSNIIIGLFVSKATAGNEENVQTLIKASNYLSIFTFGIVGPIVEELVFRKSFRDVFKKGWLFILVSGLVFGGLHVVLSLTSLWDLFYLIPYCSLGIAFGYIYVKTDNIYYSMFIHIFHNVLFTILSVYGIGVILW